MRAPRFRRPFAILSSALLLVAITAGPATAGGKWDVTPGCGQGQWCEFLCYYYVCDPDHPAVPGIQRAMEARFGPVACACTLTECPK